MFRPSTMIACSAVLAIAIISRVVLMGNPDVSWLMTAAGQVVDGRRLYVDVIELNPPMSIFIYAPAVVLSRLLSVSPDVALDGLLLVLAFAATVWFVARMPRDRDANAADDPLLAPWVLATIAVLPAISFGQREHVALILVLPWLVTMIRRAHAAPVGWTEAIIAGLCAGLTMAIKPHFALALAASGAVAALYARSWRTFFTPENFTAGVVVVGYGALVALAFPSYGAGIGPIIRLYLMVKTPPWKMLFGVFPALVLEIVALALFLFLTRRLVPRRALAVIAAAMMGFAVAAVVQGKGWPYHFLPAFILASIFLGLLSIAQPAADPFRFRFAAIALALFGQFWFIEKQGVDMRGLEKPIAALGPGARMMVLTGDSAVAFPATPKAGAGWAFQSFAGWVPYYAGGVAARDGFNPTELPFLRGLVEQSRRVLAADLRDRHPDGVLIERRPFDFLEWARRDAEIARLLDCFEPTATVADAASEGEKSLLVDVFARKASPPKGGECPVALARAP